MEIKEVFTRYANDVITTCAFGINVDSMKNPKNKFYVYGREATNFDGIAFAKTYVFRILPRLADLLNLRLVCPEIANFFEIS